MGAFLFDGVGPLVVLVFALSFGPLPIVARGLIRGFADQYYVHGWYGSVCVGLATGMLSAAAFMAFKDPNLTLNLVLLCLLFLLSCIDWQWRWLPIEWTLSVIVLGLMHAVTNGDVLQGILQILVPCLALLAMRQVMFWMLGKETLGLGDIWLIAGLGAFLPVFDSFLLIGLAAVSGLLEETIRARVTTNKRKSTGVSYGTHLCVVFVILQNLPQII